VLKCLKWKDLGPFHRGQVGNCLL